MTERAFDPEQTHGRSARSELRDRAYEIEYLEEIVMPGFS
jgi:hypothetical protein